MKIKTSKCDYVWSYFAYILKFGVNLLIFPLVLRLLSSSEYGLWVTFISLGAIVNLFDFGFSSTLLRNMTYVWGGAQELHAEGFIMTEDNSKRNDRLFILTFRTYQRIYFIIAIISIIASFTVGLVYIEHIIHGMYKPEYIIAWFIYGINISLNLYYAYWSISLRSVGAIQQSQKAIVFGYLVQLAVSCTGLLLGWGIISLAIAGCLCGITIRLVSRFYFIHFKDIGDILKKHTEIIEKNELRNTFRILWYNAKRAGISSIATVAMAQCTTLICSAYLGMSITGEYGLCLQLFSALSGVAQIYYQTTIPQLTQSRHYSDIKSCQRQFSLSVTIAWGIYALGFVTVLLIGKPLLNLIDSQTALNIPIFLIMLIYTFGEMNYSMHASYISLENKLPFVPSIVITAIAMIILSFICVNTRLGIWGILGVRCVVETAYIFWKWPLVAHRQLEMNTADIVRTGVREWGIIIKRELFRYKNK